MPDGHFDPLPESFSGPGLTRSGKFVDVEILGGLTVGGSITGGTITGATVTGTTITGGTITGTTISGGTVIAADMYSDNWESGGGTVPLSLPDSGATVGYALDASTGIIQAQDIRAEGGTLGDLTIAGTLTMGANAIWQTAASGSRWVWDINSFGDTTMTIYSDLNNLYTEGSLYSISQYSVGVIDFSSFVLQSDRAGDATNNAYAQVGVTVDGLSTPTATATVGAYGAGTGITVAGIDAVSSGSGAATLTLQALVTTGTTVPSASLSVYNNATAVRGAFSVDAYIRGIDGTASAPAYSNMGNANTGIFFSDTNEIAFSSGGTEAWMMKKVGDDSRIYTTESNDYMEYDNSTEEWAWYIDSTARFNVTAAVTYVGSGLFRIPKKTSTGDPTATDEGDMYVNTTDNVLKVYEGGAWRTVASW